jgi:outer membrane lipoprotein SlyB
MRCGREVSLNAAAVVLVGALIGATAGVAWGWLGSGGYEANDSMVGTGFLGALAGALAGAVLVTLRRRR